MRTWHGRYAYTESDEISTVTRRRLRVDGELPMKETYGKFVSRFLREEGEDEGPHDGEPRSRRGRAGE